MERACPDFFGKVGGEVKKQKNKTLNMKFFVATILTAILAFISSLFLPWWGVAIAAALVALLVHQKGLMAFASGLLGVSLLWGGLAYWMNSNNDGVLASRIANVLPLQGNQTYLIILTAVVGGLIAGLAAMSGSFLRATKK
jgi:hypothetical protein